MPPIRARSEQSVLAQNRRCLLDSIMGAQPFRSRVQKHSSSFSSAHIRIENVVWECPQIVFPEGSALKTALDASIDGSITLDGTTLDDFQKLAYLLLREESPKWRRLPGPPSDTPGKLEWYSTVIRLAAHLECHEALRIAFTELCDLIGAEPLPFILYGRQLEVPLLVWRGVILFAHRDWSPSKAEGRQLGMDFCNKIRQLRATYDDPVSQQYQSMLKGVLYCDIETISPARGTVRCNAHGAIWSPAHDPSTTCPGDTGGRHAAMKRADHDFSPAVKDIFGLEAPVWASHIPKSEKVTKTGHTKRLSFASSKRTHKSSKPRRSEF